MRRACGQRGDRLDDQRPERLGQVVAHAVEHRAARRRGSSSAVRSPPLTVDQRVDVAVDDERRRRRAGAGPSARPPRGDDGQQLAADARRVEAAVVRRGRPRSRPRSSSKCSGLPISSAAVDAAGDVRRRARSAAGVEQRPAATSGVGLADVGVAGGRHDRRQRQHPLGVLDRHRLHDHPAHRRARRRGPGRCRGASSRPMRVVGHVGQRVRRRRLGSPASGRHDRGHEVELADAVELRRQADVAVVVADDEEAAVDERLAEARRPTRSAGRRGPSPAAAAGRPASPNVSYSISMPLAGARMAPIVDRS